MIDFDKPEPGGSVPESAEGLRGWALAPEARADSLGAGAMVRTAGLLTLAAITGQTVETSRRRREGSR